MFDGMGCEFRSDEDVVASEPGVRECFPRVL